MPFCGVPQLFSSSILTNRTLALMMRGSKRAFLWSTTLVLLVENNELANMKNIRRPTIVDTAGLRVANSSALSTILTSCRGQSFREAIVLCNRLVPRYVLCCFVSGRATAWLSECCAREIWSRPGCWWRRVSEISCDGRGSDPRR